MSESINLNVDCDINELIDQIGHGLQGKAISDRTFEDGSRFVSCLDNGEVVSAYNDPNKWHSATADGGLFGKQAKSVKPPGEWAVATASAGIMGRKTHYDSW